MRSAKFTCLAVFCTLLVSPCLRAQDPAPDAALIAHCNAVEKELESIAIIERKVMVPMRDGKRMQADIYRPKDTSKKYPIIFSRTPYNFNYWDVKLGVPRDMSTELEAVKRGYAYIEMNERGRYFSEGDYDILGVPLTDSDDELDWMGGLPWSADKVGLIGCSSTAEWQLAVASRGNKALATFIPESFGVGVGRVAPYYEQGSYKRATEHTMVGERDLGDARLDYDAITFGWFDHFLKGDDQGALAKTPKIRYYTMGLNKWQSSDTWPPEGAKPVTYYLASGGHANSLNGDGALLSAPAAKDAPDQFVYDSMNPVPTHGGGFCCMGADYKPGAVDQRAIEARADVLVYSTGPLKEGLEVSGPIDVTLYVASDVKDTDITVKLVEVLPDGPAYNIDDNIQRLRYREGYDKRPVWMEKGKVYKVTLQPMQTSTYFARGEELRIEVSSSNFPRFDRNLNTGGNNVDETTGVAHNEVHHSAQYPSSITLSVVNK